MYKKSGLVTALLITLLTFGSVNTAGLQIMRLHHTMARLLPISEFDRSNFRPTENVKSSDFQRFLEKNGFSASLKSIDQVINLQQFIGDSVKNVGVYHGKERSIDLLRRGMSGTPLACGSMTTIMHDALTALGYESRIVQLFHSNFSSKDTHVLLEVFLEEAKEWVVFDPTFHITYTQSHPIIHHLNMKEPY